MEGVTGQDSSANRLDVESRLPVHKADAMQSIRGHATLTARRLLLGKMGRIPLTRLDLRRA
jgi:hypothetical protein